MDILDDWIDDNFEKSPFIPDSTLSTAIRDDATVAVSKFLDTRDLTGIPKSLQKICKLADSVVPKGDVTLPAKANIYPLLWGINDKDMDVPYDIDNMLKLSTSLADSLTKAANSIYSKDLDAFNELSTPKDIKHKIVGESLRMLKIRLCWTKIRDIMYKEQTSESVPVEEIKIFTNWRIIRIKDMLFVKIDDAIHILSYQQVLMIVDTITSRFLSLEMCKILEVLGLPFLPRFSLLRKLYEMGDKILCEFGNEGYRILGTWESMYTGVYLKKYEALSFSKNYYEGSIEGMRDDLKKRCMTIFNYINAQDLNPNQIFELFGCYRHFGHPTVDESAGCSKLKERTRVVKKIDTKTCRMAAGGFARCFILNFIRKRGRWPQVDLYDGCTQEFADYVLRRPLNLNEFSSKFPITDWSYIKFSKEFEFDYFQDFTEILSDKSISPSLKSWTSVYEQSMIRDEWKSISIENRRVLIEILQEPSFVIKEIMDRIMNDDVPHHWYIVGLHSKEREMKIESRLFAMMVIQMRVYFAVTEANIAKNIFPFIPQQTMTMGEPELNNHLMSVSRDTNITTSSMSQHMRHEGSDSEETQNQDAATVSSNNHKTKVTWKGASGNRRAHHGLKTRKRKRMTRRERNRLSTIRVSGSLDFIKWNQQQTYKANFLIFRMIEQLMGVPGLYNFTHKFFQRSWFYLSSRLHPPASLMTNSCTSEGLLNDLINQRLGENNMIDPKETAPPITSQSQTKKGSFVCDDQKLCALNDDCCWYGQYGGCEGLRQKGWTLTTIGLLVALEYETGIRASITGQGDNQVLVAEMPIDVEDCTPEEYLANHLESLETRLSGYFKRLTELVEGLGWGLKASETWFSTSLVNYGKEILHKGIFLTSTLKKVSRMFPDMSDCYPNLSSRLSSICSTAHSACQKSFCHLPIYWLMYFELCLILQKEMSSGVLMGSNLSKIVKKGKLEMNLELISFLLCFPKDFGGYPTLSPLNIMYRGHPDPVVNDVEWLMELINQYQWPARALQWAYSGQGFSPSCNNLLLIQDPTSLNFNLPSSPITLTRKMLEDTVSSFSRNNDIKLLLSFINKKEEADLVDYLMSTRPLSPRILNEIYRHTTIGAARAFLNIFVEMRTTKNMMSASQSREYLKSLEVSEVSWFHHLVFIYRSLKSCLQTEGIRMLEEQQWYDSVSSFCSTQYVQSLRDRSWKNTIHHVTTPSPHHQSRMFVKSESSMLNDNDTCNPSECDQEHMMYVILPASLAVDDCEMINVGHEPPYFGSRTQEKRSSQVLPIQRNDRSLESVKKLSRLLDWVCDKDSNLGQFISSVIKTRSDIHPTLLQLIAGENYGGSVQHRFEDVITKHSSSLNTRPNFTTRIYFSSDGMGKYGGGGLNYAIHYQGWILNALSRITHYMSSDLNNSEVRICFYQVPACSHCLHPLEESFIDSIGGEPPVLRTSDKCVILYNPAQHIFEGLDLTPLRICNFVYPGTKNVHKESLKGYAVSWILSGESDSIISPYLLSSSDVLCKTHHNSRVSQAVLQEMSLTCLLRSYAKVFMSMNCAQAMDLSIEHNMEIIQAYRIILHSKIALVWKTIRLVLLCRPIWDQLVEILKVTPPSSEVFTNMSHLDAYLYRVLDTEIKSIWEGGDFSIELYATTSGITLDKIFRFWISTLQLHFLRWSNSDCKTIQKSFNHAISENRKSASLNNNEATFLITLNRVLVRNKIPFPPDLKKKYRLVVSGCGAEPWTKVVTRKEVNEVLYAPISQPEISQSPETWLPVLSALRIYQRIVIRRERCNALIQSQLPSDPITNSSTGLRTRTDHQYRLTGQYSTAHYKYACLYKYARLKQVRSSVHLAEGAGGLANFTCRLYGVKRVYYNSLLDLASFVPQRAESYTPAALRSLVKDKKIKLYGVRDALTSGGDLLNEKVVDQVGSVLTKIRNIDLVTCDAETSGSWATKDSIELAYNVAKIISKIECSTQVIFKTYNERPALLNAQAQIFLQLTTSLSIVVPNQSSHECYECFIVFRSDPKTHQLPLQKLVTFESDLGSTTQKLRTLRLTRLQVQPLQNRIKPFDTMNLHKFFLSIGLNWNLGVVMTNLTKGVMIESLFWEDPLKESLRVIDMLYHEIVERVKSFRALWDNDPLSLRQLQLRGMSRSEGHTLTARAEAFFNIKVILHCLFYREFPDRLFSESVLIFHESKIMFIYNIDKEEWLSKYGRDIYKFMGFVLRES
ncbi:MAG: RNA-dependent RNA polymerase [Fushun ischnura senegalensis lispivirus 1]|uniref:RNA-directed RNA polymerase L n=1 Tax=Fushun ischnura senegalensis lispivirus 1 TaxID=2905564 RepID=A0A8K1XGV6_9MONO|nr:MAG: RNA-dependent RNA polymerase [Fushun ischnura senegalensis lispivirus 1]UHM27656.1 MAG: RNA-dependent RNA polymerase [Fushun ischnura senegalensis lispivirus 1]